MPFRTEKRAGEAGLASVEKGVLAWPVLTSLLLFTALSTLAAAWLLPAWVPGLVESLLGPEPKAYWYLARASALVAYAWLWVSMAFGLLITNKLARVWPGGLTAMDLHQYASLLGLLFALFHALILLGDQYIGYNLVEILLPFASYRFRPAAVGIGQVAFYGWMIVAFTFYIRRRIGPRTWRLIHIGSFITYAMAGLHALTAGTDTGMVSVQAFYWVSAGSLLWLLFYRMIQARWEANIPRMER